MKFAGWVIGVTCCLALGACSAPKDVDVKCTLALADGSTHAYDNGFGSFVGTGDTVSVSTGEDASSATDGFNMVFTMSKSHVPGPGTYSWVFVFTDCGVFYDHGSGARCDTGSINFSKLGWNSGDEWLATFDCSALTPDDNTVPPNHLVTSVTNGSLVGNMP